MDSLKANLYTLSESRRLGHQLAQNTPREELLIIPEGFSNNILWLLGHILFVQKKLTYGLSKLDTQLPQWVGESFGPGSSPKSWKEIPSIDYILEHYLLASSQLQKDLEDKLFIEFIPYTTKIGTALNSLQETIAFNNFHEGLHLGQMLSIRRIISQNKKQISTPNQKEN
jgi:hypothetical protein